MPALAKCVVFAVSLKHVSFSLFCSHYGSQVTLSTAGLLETVNRFIMILDIIAYGSGHEGAALLLPGFAIS